MSVWHVVGVHLRVLLLLAGLDTAQEKEVLASLGGRLVERLLVLLRRLDSKPVQFDSGVGSQRRRHRIVDFLSVLDVLHVRLVGHLGTVLLVVDHVDARLLDGRILGSGRRYLLPRVDHLDVLQLL